MKTPDTHPKASENVGVVSGRGRRKNQGQGEETHRRGRRDR